MNANLDIVDGAQVAVHAEDHVTFLPVLLEVCHDDLHAFGVTVTHTNALMLSSGGFKNLQSTTTVIPMSTRNFSAFQSVPVREPEPWLLHQTLSNMLNIVQLVMGIRECFQQNKTYLLTCYEAKNPSHRLKKNRNQPLVIGLRGLPDLGANQHAKLIGVYFHHIITPI